MESLHPTLRYNYVPYRGRFDMAIRSHFTPKRELSFQVAIVEVSEAGIAF